MTKILVPAAVAAMLAFAPLAALAQTGGYYSDATIQSVNPTAMTVKLSDGSEYTVAYAGLLNQLQPGSTVNFRWQDSNGNYEITSVNS